MSDTSGTTTTAAPGTVAATDSTGAATTATTTPATSSTASDSTTLFGFPLGNWVERGFLVIIGLVIVAFGLWHLFTAPQQRSTPP